MIKIVYAITSVSFFLFPSLTFASDHLVVNEFMPHPSQGSDWVEIFNPTSSSIDLSGWSLSDNTSSVKSLNGTIDANSFLVFEVSNRLNNSGDSLILKDSSQNIIDSYTYSQDFGTDVSFGRLPDGGDWIILSSSTRGSPNLAALLSPTLIVTTTPSPTSTLIPSPTPTLPTAAPTPSLLPDWIIEQVPDSLNATDTLSIKITLNNLLPNSLYYLKGVFVKTDSQNYFGKNLVNNVWIKNNQSYTGQKSFLSDGLGSIQGELNIMVDIDDSGFTGSGNYIFKIGRYNSSGNGPAWSDSFNIILLYAAIPTATAIPTKLPTSTPSPITISTPSQSPSIYPTEVSGISSLLISTPSSNFYKIPDSLFSATSASTASSSAVLGSSTKSVYLSSKANVSSINLFTLAGLVFIGTGLSFLPLIFGRKLLFDKIHDKANEIFHKFSFRNKKISS